MLSLSNFRGFMPVFNALRVATFTTSSQAFALDLPKSIIIPKPEIPQPTLLPTEKKINPMNILRREALLRANHDNRAALFVRRASPSKKMCPGDVVMVESANNMTNSNFTSNFLGICIAIHRRGIDTSFTLRNIVLKTGVEIKFKAFSPLVRKIKILRKGTGFRRAKLYYLRERKNSIIKSKSAKKLSEAYQLAQLSENQA